MEGLEINEKKIRKELDELLENAKNIEDTIAIPSLIDDYIEEGYNVREYIYKYNLLVQKLYFGK